MTTQSYHDIPDIFPSVNHRRREIIAYAEALKAACYRYDRGETSPADVARAALDLEELTGISLPALRFLDGCEGE